MREDRVFVRDGRHHHRRTYSTTEVKAGAAVVVLLAVLLGWVIWKGAHPDPRLFEASPGVGSEAKVAGAPIKHPAPGDVVPAAGSSPLAATAPAAAPGGDRGPLPADLAPPEWREGPVTRFDAENLYVKIDGRADYYISFGFVRLWCVTLTRASDPALTVDVELFDQGKPENALGAYAGERSPEARPTTTDSGLWHVDRNALFLAHGRFYARLIGADESAPVVALLAHLRERLAAGLPGDRLPWSYALFVNTLGLPAGSVKYHKENAFSLECGRDVHSVLLADGETELFVVATASGEAAKTLAARFVEGFAGYGERLPAQDGAAWIRDRYISTIAGAGAAGPWVIGVRSAPDLAGARAALARLRAAVAALKPPSATTDPSPADGAVYPGGAVAAGEAATGGREPGR